MFLVLFTVSLLIRKTTSAESGLAGWSQAPNYRGTWDIITSCVLTLTVCVWSALHLNVPSENSRLRTRNIRRLRWILLGIFAPELVVSTAFAQYLTASWLHREIRKDVEYRKKEVRLSFSFMSIMLSLQYHHAFEIVCRIIKCL
jgi:hypothetical protein